ncbi:phage tail tape measure protein [Lactococcus lactis]|uniref:phage tail tape measure protein n=1 Tax=Lactococcus lactis TaxID=1358 RepID=UPI0021AE943B|nr:phage tail tape measure protein [Lactococcus lactis]MCT0080082.1 phage tail tape measure protein [Lactococcus lactis subsp. lactis]MCT0442451.1 phage tail tape measure protein [Lactococcus lactis subsp. lactis]
MADIMVDSVTTGIDLNETKAVEAINRLKSAVKDSTREWQINEAQAKSAGDAVSASKYRYEGLSEAMEKQKAYIANLSEGMKTINRDTDAGEKAYQKYNAQLTTAERSLASMTGQLNRAKSAYEYQQTGIEDLNKSLSANDKLMQSQIDLYEKTRNKMGAAKAEISGLSTSYAKQTEIYRAQVTELKRLEAAEGTSSETLVKQKTRVNEAASSLLNYRNKLLEANLAVTKMQPFNSESLIGKGLNTVYQTTEKATTAMAAGYQKVKNAAYQSAFGIAAIGAAAIKGSQMAADLQDSYIRTANLAVTGGEKVAEVTKNVAQMQKDGAKYSVEYGKSQAEIAEGYQELIKRGYTSTEALGAMRSELQASVASGDDFNNVLSVTSQVVDAYGMRTDNAAQMTKNTKDVVNQLAYAADMTATDFASMGKSMEYVGDSAHSAGFHLSETSSAIGILSNHGLEADKAGTGLRKVINSITGALSDQSASQEDAAKSESALNEKIAEHQKKLEEAQAVVNSGTGNTKAATKAIEKQKEAIGKLQDKVDQLQSGGAAKDMLSKLGIKNSDLVDANGNLKDLTTIMSIVNDHTKNMGTAEKNSVFQQLFGTTGQQAGIILAQNNKELEELNNKVKNSADGQGYVANLAKKNMGSVKSEIKQFKAAGEAVLIMIGQKFLPVLSDAATSMAKAFNSKEGKQGLEEIASWIAEIFQKLVDTVKFIGEHKDFVVNTAKVFASIWAVNKIGDALSMVKKINNELKIMSGINALSDALSGGGIKTSIGKGVAAEAGTVASTVTKGGVAAEGEALVASGGLSKATSLIPRLLGIIGSVGGSTVLSGGINAGAELLSKDSTAQKTGGVAGSLGGAAAGAAIGSLIAPGIGTAIGAAIGGMGGKNLGKKLGDLINDGLKESSLKSEKLPVVKFDPKAPTKDMKEFSKDYQGFLDKINKSSNVDIVDEKSLEKAKKATADAYTQMSKDIDKFYQKQEKDSKKQIDILVKNGVITQAQADKLNKGQKDSDDKQKAAQKKNLDEMKKNTDKYYSEVAKSQKSYDTQSQKDASNHANLMKKIKSGNTSELLKIEKTYGKNSPQYQQEMNKEIAKENSDFNKAQKVAKKKHNEAMNKLEKDYAKMQTKAQEQMNSQINTATKIAQNKQMDLLEDLKNKKGKLNQKQLIDTLEKADDEYKGVKDKAQKQKDEAIKAANEKYKKTVAAADKERAENGSMSKAQYDEIVKNAQKQRDGAISAAKKQQEDVTDKAQKTHDKTVELANSKADKNVKAAAKEQGETVEQYTKGFKDSRNLINSFIDGINGVLNFLHKGWGNIGHVSLKGFATGTRGLAQDETALVGEEGFELAHHPNRGIFAVGQQGPEIRNLKAGTSILPHSMSKEFLSLTANLPAHADGVSGFLSDALGWVKSTYKDVTSVISKGPKGVVEAIYNGLGLDDLENDFPPVVTRMAKGSAQTAQDNFVKFLQSFFKKAESDAGGSQGSPSGSGVQRWAGQVKQALAANGLSTSQDMIDRVLRQIASESSGNEKAVQGNIGDINNITGDLAKGLMQTISSTFNANKFPGHGDIFNGYDNLLAALNYAKKTYGPSLSFLGNGHGYENGGIINAHGFYEIAEGNRPEMVIPLDPQKKSRANQLLNQAKQTINSNSSHQSNSLGDGGQLVVLVSSILTLLKNGQADPIIQLMLDKNSFAQELAEPMNKQLSVLNSRNKIINAGRTT